MSPAKGPRAQNLQACLVHESPECVLDLVRNLRHVDPDSPILLYDGGRDPALLRGLPLDRYGATVHPSPRPMRWGWLHDFALDCMRHALASIPFDTITFVDSDQLALRAGYPARLGEFLAAHPGAGVLGSSATPQGRPPSPPAAQAWKELDLWRPFLRRFPDGEAKFAHWTFWPGTVFTHAAARDLVALWDRDAQLREIMRRSRIWATEEVVLPTLAALLGHAVVKGPGSYEYLRFRARYTTRQLDAALADGEAYFVHPVPRRYDDPLRRHLRERLHGQGTPAAASTPISDAPRGLLLAGAIVAEMRPIEGWLSDEEADLLVAAAARALSTLPAPHHLVEVGSFCGKATLVLGRVAQALRPDARIHAIDPHDGRVGARDRGVLELGPTRQKFDRTILRAGLGERVRVVQARTPEVGWGEPIALLLVDGLHDYESVAADFRHLERWVGEGGLVAFHDYADYFPGVRMFVDELLRSGAWTPLHRAGTLVVVERRAAAAGARPVAAVTAAQPAALAATADGPTVTCIMPTADRRPFVPLAVRRFLAQDWPRRELLIVDDGADPVRDLVPDDPRIRYLRLSGRRTVGAKRNLACKEAQGEIIVHWDDDDWAADRRVTAQVSALLGSPGASLCGLDRVLYLDPAGARAWLYVYPGGSRPWVSGNSLCYTRDFWRRHPFADVNVGEDSRFVWSDARVPPLVLSDHTVLVALVHRSNVDPKRVHQRCWHPHDPGALRALMGDDLDAYGRAVARAAAPPAARGPAAARAS
ncbi:MAG TPA: class I SAM-dependent methyltransferase [Anaeromyxobacter sp.]|nr:class I SAM-dependent methyltransferase [Anaeromyxobacter sp.]